MAEKLGLRKHEAPNTVVNIQSNYSIRLFQTCNIF